MCKDDKITKSIAKELTYEQIADWTKQNNQILINLKKGLIKCKNCKNPVKAINKEYSKLQKICEKKNKKPIPYLQTLKELKKQRQNPKLYLRITLNELKELKNLFIP